MRILLAEDCLSRRDRKWSHSTWWCWVQIGNLSKEILVWRLDHNWAFQGGFFVWTATNEKKLTTTDIRQRVVAIRCLRGNMKLYSSSALQPGGLRGDLSDTCMDCAWMITKLAFSVVEKAQERSQRQLHYALFQPCGLREIIQVLRR